MKKKALLILTLVMILVIALNLVACNKAKSDNAPQNITYDGMILRWDANDNVDHYVVEIGDNKSDPINTSAYTYEGNGEEITGKVYAYVGKKEYKTEFSFHPLKGVETINIGDDGTLTWDAVESATGYQIELDGTILEAPVTSAEYKLTKAGGADVRVKPVVTEDPSYYSSWSKKVSVNKLAKPSKVKYDGQFISWIGGAEKYKVYVEGATSIEKEITDNRIAFSSDNKAFTVKITAIGDHEKTYDSETAEETFDYLADIVNLRVENGALVWEEIENATGYMIELTEDGSPRSYEVTEPKFDDVSAGTSITFKVKPINKEGNYFSNWSVTKVVSILAAPQLNVASGVEGTGIINAVNWATVSGASGYTIKVSINGAAPTEQVLAQDAIQFGLNMDAVGTYEISIKSNSDSVQDTALYPSRYSNKVIFTRLAAPEVTKVTSNPWDISKGFTAHFEKVNGAAGYKLYRGDTLLQTYTEEANLTYLDVAKDGDPDGKLVKYSIQSIAKIDDYVDKTTGDIYHGISSATNATVNINIQAVPKELTMKDFNFAWTGTSGSTGYSVNIDGAYQASPSTSYSLELLEAGQHEVKVCAKGDGGKNLPSLYSTKITVDRLDIPTGCQIIRDNGGTIKCDSVLNAQGYEAHVGNEIVVTNTDNNKNVYEKIQTSGTAFNMKALANYFKEGHPDYYYMTSKPTETYDIVKLDTPTFGTSAFQTEGYLRWNKPNNATGKWNVNYTVYKDANIIYENGKNILIEEFTTSNLPAGDLKFLVRANGDGVKFVDSEVSEAKTTYKLEAPVITVANNQYEWTLDNSAQAYVLFQGADKVLNGEKVNHYKPYFNTLEDVNMTLQAIGTGIDTINSNKVIYTQKMKKLGDPTLSISYSAESVCPEGKIIATVPTPVEHAMGYTFTIAGKKVSNIAGKNSGELTVSTPGKHAVSVVANGGFMDGNFYYIDSERIGGTEDFSISLYAMPQKFESYGSKLTWDGGSINSNYEYNIVLGDKHYNEVIKNDVLDLSKVVTDFDQYTSIKVQVRCVKPVEGVNAVNSEWAEFIWNRG